VTVVGTGNTPLDSVVALNPRDLFFDADIHDLDSTMPGEGLSWGPNISPLASHDFYTSAFWLGIVSVHDVYAHYGSANKYRVASNHEYSKE